MSNETLSLSLSNPQTTDAPRLILEQQPWSDYVGLLSKSQVVQGITNFIFPSVPGNSFASTCGGVSGVYDTVFFVYRYDKTLNYSLEASSGHLGAKIIQDITYKQTVKCSLKDYVEFDYPSDGLVGIPEWVGPVYSSVGDVVDEPTYTVSDEGITFSSKVYGSLRVSYRVNRHMYTFSVPERLGALENAYFAVVYAAWDGGIKGLEAHAPKGFEFTNGSCNNGTLDIKTSPKDYLPEVSPKDDTEEIDYCTQEKLDRQI